MAPQQPRFGLQECRADSEEQEAKRPRVLFCDSLTVFARTVDRPDLLRAQSPHFALTLQKNRFR